MGECPSATVGFYFIMVARIDIPDDEFLDNDFFLDIDYLLGDMTNGVSASCSTAPYVMLSSLLGLAFGLLLVAIVKMDMIHVSYVLDGMTRFNNLMLVSIMLNYSKQREYVLFITLVVLAILKRW